MRTLKFRCWNKEENNWLNTNYLECINTEKDNLKALYSNTATLMSIIHHTEETKDRVVIQQFVGVMDKNGREIYEGDLLEFSYRDDGKTLVANKIAPKKHLYLIEALQDIHDGSSTKEWYNYLVVLALNFRLNQKVLKKFATSKIKNTK